MKIQTKTKEISIWDMLISRETNEFAVEPYDIYYICQKLNELVTKLNPDLIVEFCSDNCEEISADIQITYAGESYIDAQHYINAGKWETIQEFKKRIPKKLKIFLNKLDKEIIKL